MSTRSTTHFTDGGSPTAIIYRHTDGYPDCAGTDLYRFLADVSDQCGRETRFDDASYLAAKYVVWLAGLFAPYSQDYASPDREADAKAQPLRFLSVGVVATDPSDIEYRYEVNCNALDADGLPTVTCYPVEGTWEAPTLGEAVEIPRIQQVDHAR